MKAKLTTGIIHAGTDAPWDEAAAEADAFRRQIMTPTTANGRS